MEKKNWIIAAVLAAVLVLFLLLVWEPTAQTSDPSGAVSAQALRLQFSELCTKNDTVICDNYGRYSDYVELYNAGDTADLTGCYFTDGRDQSPALENVILQSGEYRHFFLSDLTTGFSLGASGGDCIQLVASDGTVLAQANTSALSADQVMLWDTDHYVISMDASPSFPNTAAGVKAFREGNLLDNPQVVISELLVQNSSSFPGDSHTYPDVVELYNTTDADIFLDGWYLSDSLSNRYTYRISNVTIPAGGYLLLCCDGALETDSSGYIHTNFGLSYGETLVLTDKDGGYHYLEITYPGEDVSLALIDGEYAAAFPSLGFPNTEEGQATFAESRIDRNAPLIISEVLLSSSDVPYEGKFCDAVEITNRSDSAVSTKGWYLTDGSDPFTFPLPEQELAAGETLVILCSPQTTGFGISEGEALRLTTPEHMHLPDVICIEEKGKSLSLTDYESICYSFLDVTLGYGNTEENAVLYRAQLGQELRINEVISANASYLKGAYGKTCDWVELYNASDSTVNLGEYYISNSPNNLQKFSLPDKILEPGEYIVLFLSNSTTNLNKAYDVLPFTISSEGEALLLSKGGLVMDSITVPPLDTNVSYGRPAGSTDCDLLSTVTPGSQNSEAADICAAPIAVTVQGSYDGIEYLDIVLEGEGEIRYTTDATSPTQYSTLYTGPIRITKTTVIRAYCRQDGRKSSTVVDLTYLINEDDQLPTVCIVTDPDNLFDWETGIYVSGPNAEPPYPYHGANYFMDWEKEASVSLFETDGSVGFSEPCGIKIFGAFSRAQAKKSLACFFRGQYGCDTLRYPLFGAEGLDTYETFVLRAGGQDSYHAWMRDEVATSIAAEYTDLAVQKYRPVVVYLNGAYYGLHYIREKLNEHYVAGNYGADADTVTICEGNGDNSQDYLDLVHYARTHDLSNQEYYDYVCSKMDVQVYMDYIISQLWLANEDVSNVKFFIAEGRKWHWILYDTDITMHKVGYSSLVHFLNPAGTGASDYIQTTLINALLKNPDFYDAFMRRMAWHLNEVWTEENVIARIDEIYSMIEYDMKKDVNRWEKSYAEWQLSVESLRQFARERSDYMPKLIANYFNISKAQMREYGFQI